MKTNVALKSPPIQTAEGGRAARITPLSQLKRLVLTCMLWDDGFYETGASIASRIAELIPKIEPAAVAMLACEARDRLYLRHVPLFVVEQLSRIKGNGALVRETLAHVIQRADELAEFLAIYNKDHLAAHQAAKTDKIFKHKPLSAGVKLGLAKAFGKFNEYSLAKYDREGMFTLRDVMRLVHPRPKDEVQAALWKRAIDGKLETPDTWEVALSGGGDKHETFTRLLTEGKLGGLALLRNLRNMQQAGVEDALIRARLSEGCKKVFPYRFVVAAKYAPTLEDALETSMFAAVSEMPRLKGVTLLLVDVSGSMDSPLPSKRKDKQGRAVQDPDPTNRIDVACGLAILLREKVDQLRVATFSTGLAILAPRRGFALRDMIVGSQAHSSTYLKGSLEALKKQPGNDKADRIIVITDEQSHDGILPAWLKNSYAINVAANVNGVSEADGWQRVDGWSEKIFDYIREIEELDGDDKEQ